MTEKRCNRCGLTKPVDQYRTTTNGTSNKVYPRSNCRSCENTERADDLRRRKSNSDPYGDLRARFGLQRERWMAQAACRGMGAEQFFPTRGESVTQLVRDTCDRCPVRDECVDYSLRTHVAAGIWGGLGDRGRRKIRKETAA